MHNKPTITVNGEPMQIADRATIADLLGQLGVQTRAIAVELNHEIQPADTFASQTLQSGDSLEIVTLVGGG